MYIAEPSGGEIFLMRKFNTRIIFTAQISRSTVSDKLAGGMVWSKVDTQATQVVDFQLCKEERQVNMRIQMRVYK